VSLIEAVGLEKTHTSEDIFEKQNKRTLWRIDRLALNEPQFVCLAGRNGSGKSTLLRCLLGLAKPTKGSVQWFGRGDLPGKSIGYLPEFPILPPALEVRHFLRFLLGQPVETILADKANPLNAFPRLSVAPFLKVPAHRLSKGQQQRVLLWSALAHAPKGLVLDEPFSGLDPWARVELADLILTLAKEKGLFVIMSTHELPKSLRIACGTTWLIEDEKVLTSHGCALPE
jgi:ABC-type multidrug transport system ATPase subunit